MQQDLYQFLLVGSLTLSCLCAANPLQAQTIPDATLPVNSIVTPTGNTFVINGGTTAGSNLFHSFGDFSVSTGNIAHFNNTLTIQNIIARVTGRSISNIDGTLRANGTANLFLINPNGIIFGPNASLNVGGSFLASTARSVVFADGSEFSATNPQTPPLLTVNVPIGLQFGTTPGQIQVQGPGHNLSIDPESFKISRGDRNGLQLQPGKTLALVGGNVTLSGGNLTVPSGRIELGSVSPNSFVKLNQTINGFTLRYEGIENFQDIQLSQAASLDVSGDGGEIQVQGQNVFVSDGSAILAITEGTERGGSLIVKGSQSVQLIGSTPDGTFLSGIKSQAQGEEKTSDLIIETQQLMVNGGGEAFTSTLAEGDGGNLTVRASDSVQLTGFESNSDSVSGLFSQVLEGTGKGGNLTIETGQLVVQNGAQVSTTTFGDGSAGDLTIRASKYVEIIGTVNGDFTSGFFAESRGTKDGGDLTIATERLILQDGARIETSTFGAGNAGNLFIDASKAVEVIGGNDRLSSGIFTQVNLVLTDEGEVLQATGAGGNLTVQTRQLRVQDGGQISAATTSVGRGGILTVRASDSVELVGISANDDFPSGIFTQVQAIRGEDGEILSPATGDGGDLTIETRQLTVRDGAQVSAGTRSDGQGGTLTVRASDFVQLRGTNGEFTSGLLVRSRDSSGNAGSLNITTGNLTILDGAIATVSSDLSTGAAAGNLQVNAPEIRLNNGVITAATKAGDRGNITLQSRDIQLRRNSSITTNATGTAIGGNIFINTDTLAALENSDITANAELDFGGKVKISTQGIFRQGFFGTEVRREDFPQLNPTSNITATSNLGPQFDGIVDIETLNLDPSQGLFSLPATPPALLEQTFCAVVGQESAFVITGRGGLPPNPREALNLGAVMGNEANTPESNNTDTRQIVEAQGWVIDANGTVHLVARSPTVTPYSSGHNPQNCTPKN